MGKALAFLRAFPAVFLVSILSQPSAASEATVERAVLKFEDSSGTIELSLPADSLGTNLSRLIAAARVIPVLPNLDSVIAFWGGLYSSRGLAACGCDSPLDSLILFLSDGRREAYVMHCSNIYRDAPRRSEKLGMTDIQKTQLDGRWELLREKYCPKGYGCSDGKPEDRWSDHVERKVDTRWQDGKFAGSWAGGELTKVLSDRKADFPEMTLLFTVRIKDKQVTEVILDSVAPAQRPFAEEMARRLKKRGKDEDARDGSMILRVQAWNYRRER